MSKAWKNTTNAMLIIAIIGFVTFAVNTVTMRGMGGAGIAVVGLVLPIFYIITLVMKKQRAFATAIFVLSILGVIFSAISLATYAGMWSLFANMYSLMPLIMILSAAILVCNIFLLISINKLRKEPMQ